MCMLIKGLAERNFSESKLRNCLKLFKIARPPAHGVIPSSEGPAFSLAFGVFLFSAPSASLRLELSPSFFHSKKCTIMHFSGLSPQKLHYSACWLFFVTTTAISTPARTGSDSVSSAG